MSSWFMRWVRSPTGPKTTHFWAPTCNGFFTVQALYDWNRDGALISKEMQMILTFYSCIFMRFAWMINPRNYILFGVHLSNASLQGRLLKKRIDWERTNPELAEVQRVARLKQKEVEQVEKDEKKQASSS